LLLLLLLLLSLLFCCILTQVKAKYTFHKGIFYFIFYKKLP
jgi:TRAP-type C4-dicarboxylate transport system permease small subunit